jgi:hypothetical protein
MEKVGTKVRVAKRESKLAMNHKRPSHGEASVRGHSCRNDLHFRERLHGVNDTLMQSTSLLLDLLLRTYTQTP